MTYENLGPGALDYYPCRYGDSKLLFRGPRKKMAGDYIAMIGGSETYGKFIETPFVDLTSQATGLECVNFGCMNAGVDVFSNEPVVTQACSKARVTVVQVVGAQNMTNRFYAVHPRRNDRFLRASDLLNTIFRDVDYNQFHFTKHLLCTLQEISADRFKIVRDELKEAWVARLRMLMEKIDGPSILLWFAGRRPEDSENYDGQGYDPLFIDRDLIERVRPLFDSLVEVVPSEAARQRGLEGMKFSPLDEPAAREMPGVGAHEEVAQALAEPIMRLLNQ